MVSLLECSKPEQNSLRTVLYLLKNQQNPALPRGIYAREIFTKVEYQKARYPHLHVLVWLNVQFDGYSEAGKAFITDFIDKFLTTEMPDTQIDLDARDLVRKCQHHAHTFTCYKGAKKVSYGFNKAAKSGERKLQKKADPKAAALDGESDGSSEEERTEEELLYLAKENAAEKVRQEEAQREKCKFGYPHPLSECTHFLDSKEVRKRVRGDRDYRRVCRLTEASHRIVPYNQRWLKLFCCNMDIQVVTDKYAGIEYLFSYVAKPEYKNRTVLGEVLKTWDLTLKQTLGSARSLLFEFGNCLLQNRQITKIEASMLLSGSPFYYTSTSSAYLDLAPSHERTRLLK